MPDDSKCSVLLVDDDEAVREFMGTCLNALGFSVYHARSGNEALETFQRNPSKFHLVLTDMVMPGIFGDDLAVRLRHLDPAVKILFMSGNLPAKLEPGINLEEGINFLRKPFSIEQLKRTIRIQMEPAPAR